jgi:hypothetical protein
VTEDAFLEHGVRERIKEKVVPVPADAAVLAGIGVGEAERNDESGQRILVTWPWVVMMRYMDRHSDQARKQGVGRIDLHAEGVTPPPILAEGR